jgi:hypothetical protein
MQLSYLATLGRLSYDVLDHTHQPTKTMESKTNHIRTALANGDWLSALRTASRFHDRSADTTAFKRGFDAFQHTEFYRQLGKELDKLIEAAMNRLHARFARASNSGSDEEVTPSRKQTRSEA